MNESGTLTLRNISVWDTGERIDLIVDGVRQDALIEQNARAVSYTHLTLPTN